MSGLKVSAYADREAARRRAEARDLSEIARQLQKMESLSKTLSRLSVPPASSFQSIRTRMENRTQPLTVPERQSFIARLNQDADNFETAIREARIDRQRFALTARSLLREADGEMRRTLDAAVRKAQSAGPDAFRKLRQDVEGLVTQRILKASSEITQKAFSPEARAMADAFMSSHAPRPELPKEMQDTLSKIDKLLGLLSELGQQGDALGERAQRLFEVPASADFQLKLDSLCLDAAALRDTHDQRKEIERKIGQAIDMLAPFEDPQDSALKDRLNAALTGSDENAHALTEPAFEHARLRARQQDAEKARGVMLSGLVALGYEVHIDGEGWSEGERISVSLPEEPNYDVQLAARADGKVQAKVRAFRHSGRSEGTTRRDLEVEERWCSDLRNLHNHMEAQGFAATLERAESPGALPPVLVDHPGKRRPAEVPGTTRQRSSDG